MPAFLSKCAALLIVLASLAASAAERPTPNQPVANFTLKDFRGQSHSLDELKDNKLVVVAFLGTECPLAKLYGPRLAKLAAEF